MVLEHLKQITQRISRKRITIKHNEKVVPTASELTHTNHFVSQQAGQLKEHSGDGPKSIFFSLSSYQAHEPVRDRNLLVVSPTRLF